MNFLIFNSKGLIASHERDLIILAVAIMFALAIPLLISIFYVAWKYRAGNNHAKYTPNVDRSKKLQTIRLIPILVITVLALITWKSTHALDPRKAIESNVAPITIQVVALQWKWLFIYPQQHIATVNFVQFPADTPVQFELTAEAPMSSFWIPQLSGQIYAMTGMSTHLNVMAEEVGEFQGSAAEINGAGFAGMKFTAKATTASDFNKWVSSVKKSKQVLSLDRYNKLAQPSENNSVETYSSTESDLYTKIIMKFMPEHIH